MFAQLSLELKEAKSSKIRSKNHLSIDSLLSQHHMFSFQRNLLAFDPGFGILPSSSSSASPLTSASSTATSIINNNVNKSPIELPNNKKKTKRPKGTQGHEGD